MWDLVPDDRRFYTSGYRRRHYTVLKPDGTVVKPKVFLRSRMDKDYEMYKEDLLLSTMPIEQLKSATATTVDKGQIVKCATDKLMTSLVAFDFNPSVKVKSTKRVTYPASFLDASSEGELEVWEVEFLADKTGKPSSATYEFSRMTVFVTSDLKTSDITMGYWEVGESGQNDEGAE